jgi:hypothetical protein
VQGAVFLTMSTLGLARSVSLMTMIVNWSRYVDLQLLS